MSSRCPISTDIEIDIDIELDKDIESTCASKESPTRSKRFIKPSRRNTKLHHRTEKHR